MNLRCILYVVKTNFPLTCGLSNMFHYYNIIIIITLLLLISKSLGYLFHSIYMKH